MSGFDDIRDAELARVARRRKEEDKTAKKALLKRACVELSARVESEGTGKHPLSEELAATLRSFARKLGLKTAASLTTCRSAHRLIDNLYEMIEQM